MNTKTKLSALIVLFVAVIGAFAWWAMTNLNPKNTTNQTILAAPSNQAKFSLQVKNLAQNASGQELHSSINGILSFNGQDMTRVDLSGTVSTADQNYQISELTLLSTPAKSYFKIGNISVQNTGSDYTKLDINSVAGKWFYSSASQALPALPFLPVKYDTTLSNQIISNDAVSNAVGSPWVNFFTLYSNGARQLSSLFQNLNQTGSETIDNIDTVKYTFSGLDPQTATALVNQLSTTQLSDDDKQNYLHVLQNQIAELNLSGSIWVNKSDNTLKKITFSALPKTTTSSNNINLGLEINFTNLQTTDLLLQPTDAASVDTFDQLIKTVPALNSKPLSSTVTNLKVGQ